MAEDAAQETFVRAFCTLDRLKAPAAFYPWLLGIARRVAQEMNRSEERHQHAIDAACLSHQDNDRAEDRDVRQAIAQLPPACQRVVLLRYYGRLSCREVAERLELSIGSVTKTLSRAHSRLRRLLQPTDSESSPAD
jgi:RNA polymerase sigma-70 factor (ECF subfamily)